MTTRFTFFHFRIFSLMMWLIFIFIISSIYVGYIERVFCVVWLRCLKSSSFLSPWFSNFFLTFLKLSNPFGVYLIFFFKPPLNFFAFGLIKTFFDFFFFIDFIYFISTIYKELLFSWIEDLTYLEILLEICIKEAL